MLFEFQLDNDILGPLIINECDGWKEAKLKLERDKNFKSLNEYFDGSFIFYGDNGIVNGGIDYIKLAEQTQGLDCEIRIKIRISLDGYTYEPVFTGQLNLALSQELPDNKIQVPIIRDDFWSKFINRLDTPVDVQSDLSLDDVPVDQFDPINIRLSSQKLRMQHDAILDKDAGFPGNSGIEIGSFNASDDTNEYVQFDWNNVELEELEKKFSLSVESNPSTPVNLFTFEYGGDYAFDIRIDVYDNMSTTVSPSTYLEIYIKVNDTTPIAFTKTDLLVVFSPGPVAV